MKPAVTGSALAARQLVPQGRERLVRGERAGGGTAVATSAATAARTPRAAGRVALVGSFADRVFLGLAGLGDLPPVRLEPRTGLGVLLLPLLALGLVPFEPLPRLGVEAIGVDVVALIVVGGGHA